ncbi:MAG: M50 family metallopeptidase [Lachnospiraceae bacterium]|nr:M50 family metallopeptidase [Lachnospiraceae bacterium]
MDTDKNRDNNRKKNNMNTDNKIKKKSKKSSLEKILPTVLYMGFCGLAGAFGGMAMVKVLPKDAPNWQEFLGVLLVMITFVVILVIQIFIHEVGHMVCGLMSGYEFISIRFFGFMIMKENGKLVRKKHSIAGTGGQCIMIPPRTDGTSPTQLFNWGGCIANVIVSVIAITFAILFWDKALLSMFLLMFSTIGIYLAIINGIPLKSLGNDGYNAVTLKDRPDARIAFERSQMILKEMVRGIRLKDMPTEYFDYEIGKYDLDDNIITSMVGMTINYHIDCGNYEKVYELTKYLYDNMELADIQKFIVIAELVTSILITGREKSDVDKLFTKENKKLMKIHQAQPSTHRVWYVYELLYNGDKEKADKHRKDFDKLAKNYPYKTDLENDIELMECALKMYEVSVA